MTSSSFVRRGLAALAAAGLLAAGTAATAASAAVGPQISVTPSSGLVDGQVVTVQATGFPAGISAGSAMCDDTVPATLGDCDIRIFPSFVGIDGSGAATFTRPLPRFIVTNEGIQDCAVDGCVLGVADFELTSMATAPVSFAPGPPPPSGIGVELDAPAYLDADPVGAITIPATVTCDDTSTVSVRFTLYQPAATPNSYSGVSFVSFPCTAGTPVAITSDLIGLGLSPGSGELLVEASSSLEQTAQVAEIEVTTNAAAVDALFARFADPDDTTAVADFVAALIFRIQHNTRFAQAFWRAVLGAG